MRKEVRALLRLARGGDEQAMIDLAVEYAHGTAELTPNPNAALEWLLRVKGDARSDALAKMGELVPMALLESAGVAAAAMAEALRHAPSPRVKRKAATWFLHAADVPAWVNPRQLLEEAAAAGDHLARRELGLLDPARAALAGADESPLAEASTRDADAGSLNDQLSRCVRMLEGTATADHATAIAHLEALARRGLAEAALALARHYGARPGGTQQCNAWLVEGAQAGSAEAQEALGLAYLNTAGRDVDGLPKRWKHAHHWLSEAARQGRASAAWALYQLHGNRGFTARDPVVRREALARAAELGHGEAAYLLSGVLGRSSVRDDAAIESLRWLVRAAVAGHAPAINDFVGQCSLVPPRASAQREFQQVLGRAIARTSPVVAARVSAAAVLQLSALEAASLQGDEIIDGTMAVVRSPRPRRRQGRVTREDLRVLQLLEGAEALDELRRALATIAAAPSAQGAEDALALEHALYRRGVLWSEFVTRVAADEVPAVETIAVPGATPEVAR